MRKIIILIMVVLLSAAVAGCGFSASYEEQGEYDVYYINREETALVKESYEASSEKTEDLIKELLSAMQVTPKRNDHFVLLSDSVNIVNYRYDGSNVELDMK